MAEQVQHAPCPIGYVVSTSAEQATARSAKGGISLETTYRNKITGEVIHIHDVYKSSGAQIPNHPSYRDFGKGN
jgi:hypothetical protein